MNRWRILLIDPDRDSRAVFGAALRHHGYQVAEAEDGEAGLELLLRTRPHLVVSEHPILLGDGSSFHQAVRQDPRVAAPNFLIATARPLSSEAERALVLGSGALLYKPVRPDHLVAVVRRHLEATLPPPESPDPA